MSKNQPNKINHQKNKEGKPKKKWAAQKKKRGGEILRKKKSERGNLPIQEKGNWPIQKKLAQKNNLAHR